MGTNEAFTTWKEAEIHAKMVNNALIHMFKRILKNKEAVQRKIAMDLVDQLFGSEQITGIQIKESLVKIVSTIDSSSDTATMTTMAEMSSWAVLTDKLKLSEVAESPREAPVILSSSLFSKSCPPRTKRPALVTSRSRTSTSWTSCHPTSEPRSSWAS